MQSCSVHHCIVFFLILTFTVALISASICSATVKLHQPVTLSCEHKCSDSLKWALYNNRDTVFARCDQTSCSSEEGYEISHAKYLKGDLSLTISAADFGKRNTYSCECGISDISTVHLSIETVISGVQKKSGEDLILDMTVPEPVQVLYKSRDSAIDNQICNVTKRSLQCKDEYKHRTSLSYLELTLRYVETTDSGSYTIRDMKNKEDIRVYTVSVTDDHLPWWGSLLIVLLLLLVVLLAVTGLIKYKKNVVYWEFIQVSKELHRVNHLIQQTETRSEAMREMGLLEERYKDNSRFSEQIKVFCQAKRAQLRQCPGGDEEGLPLTTFAIMTKMEGLIKTLQQLDSNGAGHPQATNCNDTAEMQEDLTKIEEWCKEKMAELDNLNNNSAVVKNLAEHLEDIGQWCSEKGLKLRELRQRGGAV